MFSLPKLKYSYNSLEPYLDRQTMKLHHSKHHAGYVSKLNETLKDHKDLLKKDINEVLKDLSKIPEEIEAKVINFGGGHANHALFWNVLAPSSGQKPKGDLNKAIKSSFGSFASFKDKLSQNAATLFGSGWVWLVEDKGKLEIATTSNQDSPLSFGLEPLLCIDVWEHAYYLKYQNRRAEYINNWWNIVNWTQVENNLKKALE